MKQRVSLSSGGVGEAIFLSVCALLCDATRTMRTSPHTSLAPLSLWPSHRMGRATREQARKSPDTRSRSIGMHAIARWREAGRSRDHESLVVPTWLWWGAPTKRTGPVRGMWKAPRGRISRKKRLMTMRPEGTRGRVSDESSATRRRGQDEQKARANS